MHPYISHLRRLVIVILLPLALTISACDGIPNLLESSSAPPPAATGALTSVAIFQRHGSQVPAGPGNIVTSSISCQSNEQMVGGGYYIAGRNVSVDDSYPSSQISWIATLHNTTHHVEYITAFVDCLVANFSVGVKIIVGENVGADASQVGKTVSARAQCPTGSVLTGGGYLTETPNGTVDVSVSEPENDQNQWLVSSHSLVKKVMKVQAIAVCATAHLSSVLPRSHVRFTIPASGDASSIGSCPSNTLLTSGGYATSDTSVPSNFYDVSSPDSISVASPGPVTQWLVKGSNVDSKPHQVIISMICMKPI
jgi:hypothetical protein